MQSQAAHYGEGERLRRLRGNALASGDERLAQRIAFLLERMTGDRCRVLRTGALYTVVRFDTSGREVE